MPATYLADIACRFVVSSACTCNGRQDERMSFVLLSFNLPSLYTREKIKDSQWRSFALCYT